MKVLDPGHSYLLDELDGGPGQVLDFVKRVGDRYPGNELPAHPGTTLQETWRAGCERLRYVEGQEGDPASRKCIELLREAIWRLEDRAARRHGLRLSDRYPFDDLEGLELVPTCRTCGHIYCRHMEEP